MRVTALVAGIALVAVVALGVLRLAPPPETGWQSGTQITSEASRTESVAALMRDQRIAADCSVLLGRVIREILTAPVSRRSMLSE